MFYRVFHRIFAVLPTLARLGVGRVVVQADLAVARAARDMQRVHHASPGSMSVCEMSSTNFRVSRPGPIVSESRRPAAVVVTAAQDALARRLPLQDKWRRCPHSSHRVVAYTHDALVTDEPAA